MYLETTSKYFEWVGSTTTRKVSNRWGHEITLSANPTMKAYPISDKMGVVEFPVFV